MTPSPDIREAVARIIDPGAWRYWDAFSERHGHAHANKFIASSLADAGKILALIQSDRDDTDLSATNP